MGFGFVESVYERAMAIEMARRGLHGRRQVPLTVYYRGVDVGRFRADFVVENAVLLELKAVERLAAAHEPLTLNYLHATGIQVALLLNFGPRATFRRFVLTHKSRRPPPL